MSSWFRLSNRLHEVLAEAERIGDIDDSTYLDLCAASTTAVTAFIRPSNPIVPPSLAPYLIRACRDIIHEERTRNEDRGAIAAALVLHGNATERAALAAAAPAAARDTASPADTVAALLSGRLDEVLRDAFFENEIDLDTYLALAPQSNVPATAFLLRPGNPIEPRSITLFLIRACQKILHDRQVSNEDKEVIVAALEAYNIFLVGSELGAADDVPIEVAEDDAITEDYQSHPHSNKPSIAQLQAENAERPTRIVSRTCGVCLTEAPFRRAVLNKCGHAICLACAEQLSENASSKVIPCPFCRCKSTFVPLIEDHIEDQRANEPEIKDHPKKGEETGKAVENQCKCKSNRKKCSIL